MTYIRFLKQLNNSQVGVFGGKATSLGEMMSAGLSVPNGFAISALACRDFEGRKFSSEFETELMAAFKTLGAKRVAIRSSALAEDAKDASWAGQLETYLNVEEARLTESIRNCWHSIKTERAKVYARGKNLSQDKFLVGVVVQEMVESDVSGVMFTADPVRQDRSKIVIEAIYGLGELIVQGIVTPDHWEVEKAPLQVSQFKISIKDRQMVLKNHKNRIIKVSESLSDKATLREGQILALAKLGLKAERHANYPQDIEWAYKGEHYFIIQSRSITTLS